MPDPMNEFGAGESIAGAASGSGVSVDPTGGGDVMSTRGGSEAVGLDVAVGVGVEADAA